MPPCADVAPVPPLVTPSVPVSEIVPVDVIGLLLTVRPDKVVERPTLVTVPDAGVAQANVVPFDVRTWPLVPTVVRPVPPLPVPSVPVSPKDPVDVIGLPVTEIPDSVVLSPTLVTVPDAAGDAQTIAVPFDVRT